MANTSKYTVTFVGVNEDTYLCDLWAGDLVAEASKLAKKYGIALAGGQTKVEVVDNEQPISIP